MVKPPLTPKLLEGRLQRQGLGRGKSAFKAPHLEAISVVGVWSTMTGFCLQLTASRGMKFKYNSRHYYQLMLVQLKLTSSMYSSMSTIDIYLGRQSQSGSNPNELYSTVRKVINHPDYNNPTHDNDIALLQLSSSVAFTDYIRPVCLAAAGSNFTADTNSWVTGWGALLSGGEWRFACKTTIQSSTTYCNWTLKAAKIVLWSVSQVHLLTYCRRWWYQLWATGTVMMLMEEASQAIWFVLDC